MIFKIALILFALFALLKTFRQFRQQRVSTYWFTIWSIFWILVIVVVLLPQTTDLIAKYVGLERGADMAVYSGIVILSYGLYRVIATQEKTRREMTEIVRQIAIYRAEEPDEVSDQKDFDY